MPSRRNSRTGGTTIHSQHQYIYQKSESDGFALIHKFDRLGSGSNERVELCRNYYSLSLEFIDKVVLDKSTLFYAASTQF